MPDVARLRLDLPRGAVRATVQRSFVFFLYIDEAWNPPILQVDRTVLRVVVATATYALTDWLCTVKEVGDLGRRRIGSGRAGSVIIFS